MPNELNLQHPNVGGLPDSVKLPALDAKDVEGAVEGALTHVEQIDAKRILVKVEGACVLLRGDVKTWREHQAAAKAAAGIVGVTRVQNELRVAPWIF
jgi:osmotically-inducible protein OsmY